MFARVAAASAAACLVLAALLAAAPAEPSDASADRDCSDFPTQAQAQSFFISEGGPGSDPHSLDADGDGRACESLPCPCAGAGGGGGGGEPARPRAVKLKGRVTDVVDGDTLDVRLRGGRSERVRLIGIDTPEVYGGAECGGRQASAAMRRIVEGRRVRLRTDPSQSRRDRYGRLLAYGIRRGGASLQSRSSAPAGRGLRLRRPPVPPCAPVPPRRGEGEGRRPRGLGPLRPPPLSAAPGRRPILPYDRSR
jgi:hypothetical protein